MARILAEANRNYRRFLIIEIDEYELKNLVGAEKTSELRVGAEVRVNEAYQKLDNLRRHEKSIKRHVEELRALATLLEPLEDVVVQAVADEDTEGGAA